MLNQKYIKIFSAIEVIFLQSKIAYLNSTPSYWNFLNLDMFLNIFS